MIRLAALGGLALLADDGPVAGSGTRGRSLALLVLVDRAGKAGVHRDRLAALLWPESDQARARHSVDQAVYTLRRALGADVFLSVSGGIALDRTRIDSDVASFVQAVEAGNMPAAAEQYRGPFLDGFHLSGAGEFERWVDGERAFLEGLFERALSTMAGEAADAGDHRRAAESWQRLAAVRPLSSSIVVELMRACDRAGDRAKALQAARIHAAIVEEELGTAPDPSVAAYVEQLTQPDERAAGPGPALAAVATFAEDDGAHAAGASHEPTPQLADSSGVAHRGRKWGRRGWATSALAATAGAVLLVAFGLLMTRRAPGVTGPPVVSVAVFDNQTTDPAFDPLGRMAADWISQGLARTGLVRVIDHASDAIPTAGSDVTNTVEGRLYRLGDSVWLQASIRDPETGLVIRALDPVATHAATPADALEPLRQQVLGAMGTLHDPRIRTFAASALRPPSYDAYREFASGMDRYSARDPSGMTDHFERAVRLDPDYLTAHLWLAWTASLTGDVAAADSIVEFLRPERSRMSPLERAWHDRQAAMLDGDNQRSYEAAVRMAAIAPTSAWTIALADAALNLGRADEALAALEDAGTVGFGPTRDHAASLLAAAYHTVGDYERELEFTAETVEAIGLDWDFVGPGVRALAALGRVAELDQRLAELRDMPPTMYSGPRGPASVRAAAMELRVHGHVAAADSLVDRAVRSTHADDSGRVGSVTDVDAANALRVSLLYEMGRWEDASRALAVTTPDRRDFRERTMAALLAARLGDTRPARRMDSELETLTDPRLFGEPAAWRARIAAVLGDDERAIQLLRHAFASGQGARLRWHLHTYRDFDGLREIDEFRSVQGGR